VQVYLIRILCFCSTHRMRGIVAFYVTYLLCLVLGIVCVVLVAFWNYTYRGGFAWDGSAKQFNWHPVFMVTGMVVLFGNGTFDWVLFWLLFHANVAVI